MTALRTHYQESVHPTLKKEFKIDNAFAVPKISKVIVNIGVSDPQDPRARKTTLANIKDQFYSVTGQKPRITSAKKSIAGFKLREGDPMGVMVTLRGAQMWQFIEKLLSIALPRVKDFRGVSKKAFDGQGNYSMGIQEQIIFPEIKYDDIERIRSLQVVFVTTTKDDAQAFRMLELLGMPFEKED